MSEIIKVFCRPLAGFGDLVAVDIPAVVVGNWAAHGRIARGDTYVPSQNLWTVTYVPSGSCIRNLAGIYTQELAIAIATALHEQIPRLSLPDVPTEQGSKVHNVVRAIRDQYEAAVASGETTTDAK